MLRVDAPAIFGVIAAALGVELCNKHQYLIGKQWHRIDAYDRKIALLRDRRDGDRSVAWSWFFYRRDVCRHIFNV